MNEFPSKTRRYVDQRSKTFRYGRRGELLREGKMQRTKPKKRYAETSWNDVRHGGAGK
jgi:hypothetical protein